MKQNETPERWLLVSLGNRFRGDDGVGPYLLDRLRSQLKENADFLESGNDMITLVGRWKDRQVCLLDAVFSDEQPSGDLIRVNGLADVIAPSVCTTSSHGFNLREAIDLGKALDSLPRRLEIFAICAQNITCGDHLTAEVKSGAERAEQELLAFLLADTGES
ncbi:hydrogenase maturation protease [Microbulbifer sp. CnH-101-G]|uniref:hydrogenase maturation protease n=1 Tax=Microbulbifer sp. CnH-101-G TaxID=3243393 RepID=UPI00403A1578